MAVARDDLLGESLRERFNAEVFAGLT